MAAMEKVAKIVGQHEMKVYEVATFYTMFNREKRGKHFIQLCGTTPCMMCGSEEIKKTIMDELGIKNGGEQYVGLVKQKLLRFKSMEQSCVFGFVYIEYRL